MDQGHEAKVPKPLRQTEKYPKEPFILNPASPAIGETRHNPLEPVLLKVKLERYFTQQRIDYFMRHIIILGIITMYASSAVGQTSGFGPAQAIATGDGAIMLLAEDFDGDGDPDLVGVSTMDNTIAWSENLGGGIFGTQLAITSSSSGAYTIDAEDFDGDGLKDVLFGGYSTGRVAWFKYLGGGAFGPEQNIATLGEDAFLVHATDLDGDGDADAMSASWSGDYVAWYENLGGGTFGPQQIIASGVNAPRSISTSDLDGDGDVDVLSSSSGDGNIGWIENLGGGIFGPLTTFAPPLYNPRTLHASDLDGDGDNDVLSASYGDDMVSWFENLGGGVFGPQQVITTLTEAAFDVVAEDLDGDGDMDVVSSSLGDSEVAWYENLGGGSFGVQQIITDSARGPHGICTADLDGDGDAEVLAAIFGDVFAYYENLMSGTSTCSSAFAPTGQSHTNLPIRVRLNWIPQTGAVGCQVQGKRLPSGPSPHFNVLDPPINTAKVLYALAGPGTTWTWRVRCACSISPLDVSPYTAYGDTFSIPLLRSNIDSLDMETAVSPNPAHKTVRVDFKKIETEPTRVRILDIRGSQIEHFQLAPNISFFEFDVSAFTSGVYFIQILRKGGQHVHPVLVE